MITTMHKLAFVALLAVVGCNNLFMDPMKQQPKFKAFSSTEMYKDKRAMREPVDGTYPQEMRYSDPALSGGLADAGVFVDRIPIPVDHALLERGRERFNIICATCHGTLGDGDSVIAHKMLLAPPPSLLTQYVDGFSDGRLEEVIRAGWGAMSGYESQITSRDRWAIVAYLRALQGPKLTAEHAP
jgi:mono/diheme cytochrome c family protein